MAETVRYSAPWEWSGDTLYGKENGYTVEILDGAWFEDEEFEAEHRALIAAAPELLASLKAIHAQLVAQGIKFGPLIADAEAAIAKATGADQ